MSKDNQERFDSIARGFDSRPGRAELTTAIAQALQKTIGKEHPRMLDFGCGTGACSLPVAAQCASVTGVDISWEMLQQYQAKAVLEGLRNVRTVQGDASGEALGRDKFDLVLCAMTLHHIEDVPALLDVFTSHLEPGGTLVLSDLDEEDGTFHKEMKGVHHAGFSRAWLAAQLRGRGYTSIQIETVHEILKPGADGQEHAYPVFYLTAERGR